MLESYAIHNLFRESLNAFKQLDPHLRELSELRYQYSPHWWEPLTPNTPGIYILTGGRQVGKSTSCKLLIRDWLEKKWLPPKQIFYLPCDEIQDAKTLGEILRSFLDEASNQSFLLIIDEVTFVGNWDRVIKALADEGHFKRGLCLLTGSDTLILKEAAMRFPGRRGKASQTDFHVYPLLFSEYVNLLSPQKEPTIEMLATFFKNYLQAGGYLRAINDLAEYNEITTATYATYEQWIRGDFLKKGKNEDTLLAVLQALQTVGVSQISYSSLTRKIGLVSKETCIDYCRLLERMDILINLQAFDPNKKQGYPRKDRKFHFADPFITHTVSHWLQREGYLNSMVTENTLVEACVANHCHRLAKTFYFKGKGEVDIIWLTKRIVQAIEIKWATKILPHDLKTLKQFKNRIILTKTPHTGKIDNTQTMPVFQFLYEIGHVQ
ncbi:ATP-binding protein [Coxiella burnetii]|uniref:ATP-binding protein n=1 Tax=Coxiella burnetii TaxID=777 RepID=UPI000183CD62|nr:ATP-binding protein [Coxiella burnetii]ACJ18121.1 hypothetical ATPase [Coxiella burnetii CbuG_Q212]ATN66521.1 ATPase [Coxiella burnetii]OYK86568.1 ATPase [Coxiella burnetii]